MRRFLLASHADFARGIFESLRFILGEVEDVDVLCAYTDGAPDVKAFARERVESVAPGDELIVVTDLFGGSVNNEFMVHVGKPGFHLVAGLNLPLLIELVTRRNEAGDTGAIIDAAVEASRGVILRCNKVPGGKPRDDGNEPVPEEGI